MQNKNRHNILARQVPDSDHEDDAANLLPLALSGLGLPHKLTAYAVHSITRGFLMVTVQATTETLTRRDPASDQ